MSNQAVSIAEDLMVGAGELYFKRNGDSNGWHHLGNVEEFNITNDITTVEKNSSMNKKRELLASVTTAVEPSASITMNEYNPYNMALGLYGIENIHKQYAATLTNRPYVVPSVPGVLEITDANSNRYFDIRGVVLSLGEAEPSKTYWTEVGTMTGAVISSGVATNDVLTDTDGNVFSVAPGSDTGSEDENVYMVVSVSNGVPGVVTGLTIKVKKGILGMVETKVATGVGDTQVFSTDSGITITVKVNSTTVVPVTDGGADANFMNWPTFKFDAPVTELIEGRDYIVTDQRSRGGVVTIPATSSLVAGEPVYVSCEVPEGDYPTVSGANAGDISGQLLFLGDPNIGGNYVIEGWKVKVTPDGDFTGLISDDFGSFSLTVKFLSDYENHPNDPFYKATMIGKSSGDASSGGNYDPKY